MALGRGVLLTVASGSLIYSGMVSALGMGDIRLHSALNQPLSAEIELLEVGDLSAEDIRVVLASSSDFSRVGVERLGFLQDLSFIPVIEGNRSRIRVTSSKPVREPYLNFLVEITRAKSRLVREYTVLLDPMPAIPEAGTRVAVAIPQAVPLPVRAEPASTARPAELPQASKGKRHRVASGESLWTIASNFIGSQAEQAQFMRDIQALNPDAFTGGDAARLKAGANLLLPDAAEHAAPAVVEPVQAEPAAEFVVQSEPVSEPAGPAQIDDQVAALRRQLFEELAASREENKQLKQMLTDMRLQLETVTAQLAETGNPPVEQATQSVALVSQSIGRQEAGSNSSEAVPSFNWENWTLPSGAALASMLLGGLWFGRRRKLTSKSPNATMSFATVQPTGVVPPVVAEAALEMPRQPAHASVGDTDVLEAANIYLTYGRRNEALDVLQRGIDRAPEQLDIRLRHLGLLAESGDAAGYASAAAGYLQAGGTRAQLDQLLALHPALASAVAMTASSVEQISEPEISFVLSESHAAQHLDVSGPAEQSVEDADEVLSVDSQSWLDALDEVLTLGDLPSLLGDADISELEPSDEQLRELEPNPDHLGRLNQAAAFIEQGDMDSACVILESLATEGDEQQRQQVNELLAKIA